MKLFLLLVLVFTSTALGQTCQKCGRPMSEHTQTSSPSKAHPPFQNRFRYRRQIDPTLQARAQREANILARNDFHTNQRLWTRNANNGHPIGVPPGYIGGTGCSWPGGKGTIATCEPDGPLVLVAEAVARCAKDGTWYASRIWRQR